MEQWNLATEFRQATFLNELKIKLSRQSFNYTGMWMLRPLWLVVPHDLLEHRYMDDVMGNLFSLVCSKWRAVLKMSVNLFPIKASESLQTV